MREMRARHGWYGFSRRGADTRVAISVSIGVSPDHPDDRDDVDPGRAGRGATPAADTARAAVFGHEAALLVIEAELHARRAALAEVLAARDERVRLEEAGIPGPHALAGARAQRHLVLHVEAVARRAD